MAVIATEVVSVVPDFGSFRRRFRPGLARETAGVNAQVGVAVDHGRLKAAAATVAKALTVAAAGAGIAAGKVFADSISAASSMEQMRGKVAAIFGPAAKDIEAFAKTAATALGQSERAALDGAARFAIYGKAAGKTGKRLTTFSTGLVTLASDMAAMHDTKPEEAIDAMAAAMRGEMDPIEKYGLILNEATLKTIALKKGIITTTKGALTPQQRVLAVQAALYEQLGKKGSNTIGAFERESASLAVQQQKLNANWENMKTQIGTGLLPVVTRFTAQLNEKVLPAFSKLWKEHGPEITAFLTKFGDKLTELLVKVASGDFKSIADGFGPLKDVPWETIGGGLKKAGEGVSSVLKWGRDHPTAVAAIVGLFAAYKGLKGAGGGGAIRMLVGLNPGSGILGAITRLIDARRTKQHREYIERKLKTIASNTGKCQCKPSTTVDRDGNPIVTDGPDSNKPDPEDDEKTRRKRRRKSALTGGAITFGTVLGSLIANYLGDDLGAWFEQTALPQIRHWFSITLPNALNPGKGEGGWSGLGDNLKRWFSTTLPDAMSGRSGGWSGFGEYVKETLKQELGWNAVVGTWNGISEKTTELKNKLGEWKDGLVRKVKELFGIQSPSTVFAAIGAELPAGLWQGYRDKWSGLWKTVSTWTQTNVIDKFKTVFSRGATAIKNAFAAPFNSLTDNLAGPVGRAMRWLNDNVIDRVNAVLRKLPGVGEIPRISWGGTGGKVGETIGDIIKEVPHLADGGPVRGTSGHSRSDNRLAMLTPNEYVQPVDAVRHYGVGFMDRLRRKEIPRYASGGLVGAMTSALGDNVVTRILGGAIHKMGGDSIGAIVKKMKSALGSVFNGVLGGGSAGGSWKAIWNLVKSNFSGMSLYSGYRRTRTSNGNWSRHAFGKAIDITPRLDVVKWIAENYGAKAYELISPWSQYDLWRGRPHRYDDATRRQHGADGAGNRHIHWSVYDQGGILPPGITMAVNKTGRNEYVSKSPSGSDGQQFMRIDQRDLVALAAMISQAVSARAVHIDGRSIGDIVHAYDYLAGGL